MRPGHWIAIDCVAGAVAALSTGLPSWAGTVPVRGPLLLLVTLALVVTVFAPVAFRRLRPVPAYGMLITVSVFAFDVFSARLALLVLLSAAYVLYTVTVNASRRNGAAALGLALTLIVIFAAFASGARHTGSGIAIPVAFAMILSWMIGYSTRQRRLYADTLRDQAASSAVAEERLRIARELHDVVAHSMSVIAVQAGFGEYVIDTNPRGAREALTAIQATSRDALEEMRRMLGVLRQQDATSAGMAPAPLAPEPGIDGLGRLIERTSCTGVRVSLERMGTPYELPASVGLSAYRIVQEALTNVVKHAGGEARCVVCVRYENEFIGISVTDDGRRSLTSAAIPGATVAGATVTGSTITATGGTAMGGAGHGIVGMRERASLCGGELTAGPLPEGGFQVTATLPLRVPAAASGGRA